MSPQQLPALRVAAIFVCGDLSKNGGLVMMGIGKEAVAALIAEENGTALLTRV